MNSNYLRQQSALNILTLTLRRLQQGHSMNKLHVVKLVH